MLEQVHLKNFQAHKDTVLDFTPGVNVILGEGDKGKTSIVRALSWIAGQKKYKDIIHHGEKECSVNIKLDGHSITRLHADKRNEIFLDGATFQKIGRDGCQEADKIVNLSGINFQFQHDAPFFLSLSPGQAANMLNEVANLTNIDAILDLMRKDFRQSVDRMDEWNKEKDAQKGRLNALEGVLDIESHTMSVEGMDEALAALGVSIGDVAEAIAAYRKLKVPAKVSINACKMDMAIGTLGQCKSKAANISDALQSYHEAKILPQITPWPFETCQQAEYIGNVVDKLSNAVKEYKSITWDDEELEGARAERDANAPAICPTCGQVIFKQGV